MNHNGLIIPDTFCEKVIRMFKDNGRDWLIKLPGLLDNFISNWELTDLKTEENLSVHYICYAKSQKYGDVVLKTGVPHLELFSGMDALLYYNGKHSCMIYESDRDLGGMLLERILPGTRLKDVNDIEERIKVGTNLVSKLPVAVDEPHGFPIIENQMKKAFDRTRKEHYDSQEFLSMLSLAENIYDKMQKQNRPKLLLHGDLHHFEGCIGQLESD